MQKFWMWVVERDAIFWLFARIHRCALRWLDQDIPSLNKCKEGLDFFKELNTRSTVFMQGSVYKLPFEENSFDLVICSEVWSTWMIITLQLTKFTEF